MLVSLLRACRRGVAGAAWLLDYTVAVALSAWDGVAVSRPSKGRRCEAPSALTEHPGNAQDPAGSTVLRPGRAAASLAVIGAVSISVVGALWSQPAPADSPAMVLEIPRAGTTREAAAPWAPLVSGRSAENTSELFAAVGEASAEASSQAILAEDTPAAAPVAASAAETAEPEATPEPTAAPPPPTPQPPPPPPAPTGQLTRAELRDLALSVGWPESEVEELLDVAWCESRYRVDANGLGALGLMQIMPFWFESLGIDVALAFDAATNLRVAYHIYQNDLKNGYGEWASWTCKPLSAA